MVIRQIQIDHFGRFHGTGMDFQEGINLIYGGNDSGKTSIRAFILFVLFGLTEKESISRYASQGCDECAGSLVFEYGGREYTARRSAGPAGMDFSVTENGSGSLVLRGEESIGSLVPGLTPARLSGLVSTIPVSPQPDEEAFRDLKRKKDFVEGQMEELKRTIKEKADEDYDERSRAVSLIKQNNEIARQYKEKKQQLQGGRQLSQTEDSRISASWDKYESLKKELDDVQLSQQELRDESDGSGYKALACTLPLLVAAGLVWFLGSSFGLDRIIRAAAGFGIIVLALIVFLGILASGSGKKRRAKKVKKRAGDIDQQMRNILRECGVGSREELRSLHITGRQTVEEGPGSQELREELASLKARYDALQGPLEPYLKKYGSSITLERHEDPELKARLDQLLDQQAQLARQMEALEAAPQSVAAVFEPAPLILDDYFAAFDDNRLKRTLNWLSRQKNFTQIIILTCHHLEGQTLTQLGIPFGYRELDE